jgi:hypothetical protein
MKAAPWYLRRWTFLLLFAFHFERWLNHGVYSNATSSWAVTTFETLLLGLFLVSLLAGLFTQRRRYAIVSLGLNSLTFHFTHLAHNGSDALAFQLLLAASIFPVSRPYANDQLTAGGFLLVMGQLLVVYLYNFSAKLRDPMWMSGTALVTFLGPELQTWGFPIDWLAGTTGKLLSWAVIALQALIVLELPLRLRRPVSSLFMLKHLLIALLLHTFFGLVCATLHLYIFFSPMSLRESLRVLWLPQKAAR